MKFSDIVRNYDKTVSQEKKVLIRKLQRIREFYLYEDGWCKYFQGRKISPDFDPSREEGAFNKKWIELNPGSPECEHRCLMGAFQWQGITPDQLPLNRFFYDHPSPAVPATYQVIGFNDRRDVTLNEVVMYVEFLILEAGGQP